MFCAKLSLYHVHDKLRLSSLLNDLLNWQTTIWHLHDTLLEIFNNIQFKCDVHPSNKSMFFPETKSWKTPKQSGTWLEYLGKLWLLTIKGLGLKSGLIAMFKITIRLLFCDCFCYSFSLKCQGTTEILAFERIFKLFSLLDEIFDQANSRNNLQCNLLPHEEIFKPALDKNFFSFILASETDGCYVTCLHKTCGTEPMNTGRCHPSRWILTDADGSPINCIVASLPIMSNDDGHFPLSADVYRSDDDQLIEKLLTWACTTSRSWRNRAAGFRSLVFTTSAPFYSDKDDQHSEKLPLYLTPDKHNQ